MENNKWKHPSIHHKLLDVDKLTKDEIERRVKAYINAGMSDQLEEHCKNSEIALGVLRVNGVIKYEVTGAALVRLQNELESEYDLASTPDERERILRNPDISEEFIRRIVNNRDFDRCDAIIHNPKTPSDVFEILINEPSLGMIHAMMSHPNFPAELLKKHLHVSPRDALSSPNLTDEMFADLASNSLNGHTAAWMLDHERLSPETFEMIFSGMFSKNNESMIDLVLRLPDSFLTVEHQQSLAAQFPNSRLKLPFISLEEMEEAMISGSFDELFCLTRNPSTPVEVLEGVYRRARLSSTIEYTASYVITTSIMQHENVTPELFREVIRTHKFDITGFLSTVFRTSGESVYDVENFVMLVNQVTTAHEGFTKRRFDVKVQKLLLTLALHPEFPIELLRFLFANIEKFEYAMNDTIGKILAIREELKI